jgi:hypothetical protein
MAAAGRSTAAAHALLPLLLLLLLLLTFFAICSETSVVHPDLFEADNTRVLHDWCLHDEGGDGPPTSVKQIWAHETISSQDEEGMVVGLRIKLTNTTPDLR